MSKNKKQPVVECPICLEQYTKTHLSYKVCSKHLQEGWIVTVCPDCGVARFSLTRGVCYSCLNKSPKVKGFGFNKNKRSSLANNGMGCKENG